VKRVFMFLFLMAVSFVMPLAADALDFFSPESCVWATAPALSAYPISSSDLRECVHDLIMGIQETRNRISSKDLEIETLTLSVKTLRGQLDLLRTQLETTQGK
jgi:hypothetical protein